jgi:hypothetical protein
MRSDLVRWGERIVRDSIRSVLVKTFESDFKGQPHDRAFAGVACMWMEPRQIAL